MTLEELTEHITVFVEPLATSGCYKAQIRGSAPDGETLKFDLELSGCYTSEILQATVTSQLEEILSCRYYYEVDDSLDESELHYDGGTFK